ncbi:family 43 glycosylhydrolase [Pectobacterium carotovorum]|uniref:family 43 glycosylhydrolase n=1 Tax=Pectobacterium carotovorum TaxID=554 RepID=UPI002088C037|nr:family 43 glycosylhydrolase [Pectobacterium carotovorum]GKW38870.1 xylosidase/arabinosidase [Pectobacterium carotovorum subsp. carotovorum]
MGVSRVVGKGVLSGILLMAVGIGQAIACQAGPANEWMRGIEQQRQADLGNGCYLNPIIAGDHPDPTIIKDGDDYYMTFSSFDDIPGLLIWHSRDLVNWEPLGPAITTPVDAIWAPDLVKHNDKYYIYFTTNRIIDAKGTKKKTLYVITADDIHGPWTPPKDTGLKNPASDPGHVVGEDGKRYIFMSGGNRVQLTDDGLSTVGEMAVVYQGWQYPEEWDVESFSQEGPKMLRHGDYFYMVLAEGGTAGPPTGHMVIAARSKSINGPWENSPHNPIIRTQDRSEKWWSRGHATLIEGPDKNWYMVYHGYENGFMTLGRQAMLEPIVWGDDGWFTSAGFDTGKPIRKPEGGEAVPHGIGWSDSFTDEKFPARWHFYRANAEELKRVTLSEGKLHLKAKGTSPKDSAPLTMIPGDQAYQIEVTANFAPGAQAGLLLFYNAKLYVGLSFNQDGTVMHRYGLERAEKKLPHITGNEVQILMKNDRHIVTFYTRTSDQEPWKKYPVQMEVSGYHHNVAYDFLSLRPALYASGEGDVTFSNLRYQALP